MTTTLLSPLDLSTVSKRKNVFALIEHALADYPSYEDHSGPEHVQPTGGFHPAETVVVGETIRLTRARWTKSEVAELMKCFKLQSSLRITRLGRVIDGIIDAHARAVLLHRNSSATKTVKALDDLAEESTQLLRATTNMRRDVRFRICAGLAHATEPKRTRDSPSLRRELKLITEALERFSRAAREAPRPKRRDRGRPKQNDRDRAVERLVRLYERGTAKQMTRNVGRMSPHRPIGPQYDFIRLCLMKAHDAITVSEVDNALRRLLVKNPKK